MKRCEINIALNVLCSSCVHNKDDKSTCQKN